MFEEGLSLEEARNLRGVEKEEFLRTIEQYAHDVEVKYWGCSQAVLGALLKYLKLGDSKIFKSATGFAGGIGDSLEACGALIGGVMAIGLACGRERYEEGKIACEELVFAENRMRTHRFIDKFREKHGSLRCIDIRATVRGVPPEENSLQYTPEKMAEMIKGHEKCGSVTGPGARFAAEVILEPFETFADEINSSVALYAAGKAILQQQ